MSTVPTPARRRELDVLGERLSFLHAGRGPALVLLHGTWWSRVWEPVVPALAADREAFRARPAGVRPVRRAALPYPAADARHLPTEERPEEVADALLAFLRMAP